MLPHPLLLRIARKYLCEFSSDSISVIKGKCMTQQGKRDQGQIHSLEIDKYQPGKCQANWHKFGLSLRSQKQSHFPAGTLELGRRSVDWRPSLNVGDDILHKGTSCHTGTPKKSNSICRTKSQRSRIPLSPFPSPNLFINSLSFERTAEIPEVQSLFWNSSLKASGPDQRCPYGWTPSGASWFTSALAHTTFLKNRGTGSTFFRHWECTLFSDL